MIRFQLVDIESQETIGKTFETGEVWARGPQVTKGYLHNQEATQNSITKDGWIKTGIFLQDINVYRWIKSSIVSRKVAGAN